MQLIVIRGVGDLVKKGKFPSQFDFQDRCFDLNIEWAGSNKETFDLTDFEYVVIKNIDEEKGVMSVSDKITLFSQKQESQSILHMNVNEFFWKYSVMVHHAGMINNVSLKQFFCEHKLSEKSINTNICINCGFKFSF